ncbi:MAG: hypothetical protein ACRC9L_00465 [Brevinema sp.]
MFGVFLLTIILFYYSVVLLSEQIIKAIDSIIVSSNIPRPGLRRFKRNIEKLCHSSIRQGSGLLAFLFAFWNFFAPDFGSGGITIVGALIPSIALFVDALLLAPESLDWIQLPQSFKLTLLNFSERFSNSAGWITLAIAFLHIFFNPLPFI